MAAAATLYTGPGKVYMGGAPLWPEGAGQISAVIQQEAMDFESGMHGRMGSLQGDATVRVSVSPLDNWDALPLLYPAYIGVKVGATAAALSIGTRPHNPGGAGNVACSIFTPDARLYTIPRAAVTKHPDIHLGPDKALFGQVEITGIGVNSRMGAAGFLYTIAEAGAGVDPGGQMNLGVFERSAWYALWGVAAGFGGDGGAAMEAEDGWTITSEVKYSAIKVQRLTRAYVLNSVRFMAKARIYGPTHTQIDAAIGLNSTSSLGQRFANPGADLVLSQNGGTKTVTLKNCTPVGAGWEFNGTKLGTGEVGFVNQMSFTAGLPGSLLEFSV